MRKLTLALILLSVAGFAAHAEKSDNTIPETHANSLNLREAVLRRTIAKDTVWPSGVWGDNLWTLAALHLNEKSDQANARLLKAADQYIETHRTGGTLASPTPEDQDGAPWTFFSITDYVRTLCLFHAKSPHFPGRLNRATEASMKEALWLWTSKESRLADYGPDDLFLLLGTENHDLNIRPVHHLVTSLLESDPIYRDRKLADGHTTAEHAAAHSGFFREWPRRRVASGMWIEVGSTTYQKYSWPALINLHELSPDPIVRHRFGLLLDLALVEEEQISVDGRRGGGRSRAGHEPGGFESMKRLLHGEGGGSSHSRVLETSSYQAPPEAILLRKQTFPMDKPFVIRNRVLGKLDDGSGEGHRIAVDSALVNYAYRTPHSLLGTTLQNPALIYSGISRQNRTSGLLFAGAGTAPLSQVHPVVEHTGGGRSQHSFWSVQHESALLLQRIARHGRSPHGSYNTGKLGVRFEGGDLEKIEENGWIFASNGRAYVAVKFLDGAYEWNPEKTLANPSNHTGDGDTTRILLQAGDRSSHRSFREFRDGVRAHPLTVTAGKVDYHFGGNRIEMHRYDALSPHSFSLPLINGRPLDLHPGATYESPFLTGESRGDSFTLTVGPRKRLLNFSEAAD